MGMGVGMGGLHGDAKGKDMVLRKHRFLRRATGFMLARKYRYIKSMMRGPVAGWERDMPTTSSKSHGHASQLGAGAHGSSGFSRDELINFWKDLPEMAKRTLLRIHREVYLNALDEFLVQQNLCCECHDNVITEWEDHERKRAGSRSLRDIFSVFPPFSEDEDDDDDDDDVDDDEDDDEEDDDDDDAVDDLDMTDDGLALDDELDPEVLAAEELLLDDMDERLARQYDLARFMLRPDGLSKPLVSSASSAEALRPPTGSSKSCTDGYDFVSSDRPMQDNERLLLPREERYIIIREDHTDFIMDLIRCGEQFSYLSPYRLGMDDEESDGEEDDGECPGANTSHLAQEYLLEVLAIKFREQLENAYQAALQHSLAVQAELLRDEIADLESSQKPSTKKKKSKKKKKKDNRENDSSSASRGQKNSPVKPEKLDKREAASPRSEKPPTDVTSSSLKASFSELSEDEDAFGDRSPEIADAIDREVEEFRLRLEKINSEGILRQKPKLVLPAGSFAHMSSSFAAAAVCTSNSFEDESLLLLQFENAFFDCTRDDEASRLDGLELTQTMRSINRLIFSCWVPPWIHQENMRGHG
ncbi:TPA: hypothetical protein N0F65_012887 [Lagenidium giganteum]|uniref:Uncharacterized protein n=1 Tax=Lagenidium giganteum TaxID=4803 RepID=A0AAV2YJ32_9STRA|nr:TPA: hypothetical protein N0F65_012887 [Lagenidium giganteum]